ncbi:MAG: pyridoxamine 5'-phosphate oxidase family protein [Bacteroidetes bacterium]|nr:pyridoxamine 5'-phosphate oxidase family protein [Bacteroidota bacterium]
MKKKLVLIAICCSILSSAIIPLKLCAQSSINRDTILIAAREIIKETTYCGLVTIDSTGQPQVRTMNPFPANDELITWFATSRTSRKVREIKNNPRVCVYYANHKSAKGYVNITGIAEVIDDKVLLTKMKREYWESIPNWQNIFVLIKIVPKTIEVINYKHGLNNDPKTFRAPTIVL